jgi:polar amino acid transport system substrate-binding protein
MKAFAALCACLIAYSANAQQRVVLYGDDDYAPYSFVEGGHFKGIYVDLLRQAARKLAPEYDVLLEPMPWKRGLSALQSGSALALFPPYRVSEREYIEPYSVPLYHETVVLYCTPQVMTSPRLHFPSDYRHLRIGINLGFALANKLVEAGRAGEVLLEEAKGNEANLRKLALGRVDCYANDRLSVLYTVKQLQNSPSFVPWRSLKLMEAAELQGQDAFLGYSKFFQASYKQDFIRRMNAALNELGKSGAVDKLVAEYTREE